MTETPTPITLSHSKNLPHLLQDLGISFLVSTYQAGKLMIFRCDRQGQIYSYFVHFNRAMGVAANAQRIAIGTQNFIKEFYNLPAALPKLPKNQPYDACYLMRNRYVTGSIDIHEMDWAGDELWFVNTAFSCLCTLDERNSFVPRWRPPFVTALAPEDRCHLNGLEVIGDRPKYITALGTTDTFQGWREKRTNGGILMDIEQNEIILQGLSMPHSPRWYQDKLWVLESGQGSLAIADLETGKWETVIKTPGFTRGLDFYGDFAFIGLSQLRHRHEKDQQIFGDLPITEAVEERVCGIWIVNIKTGQKVAHINFNNGVEEIFAVSVLAQIRYPEILEHDPKLIANSYALPQTVLQGDRTVVKP